MKTILLCGHKSQYCFAHVEPLLRSNLNIISVVLATDKRWNIFKEKLSGEKIHSDNSHGQKIKMILKNLFYKV